MKIGPDMLVLSDIGVKNISDLYRDFIEERELPNLLSYDTIEKKLKYKPILKIVLHEDVELYVAKFYDTFMSKMSAVVCSPDTEILRYDIINTKVEPIVGGSYNVYGYLKSNWQYADPGWQKISELLNHGAIAPNLSSGDLVTKFIERKIFASDNAYEVFTGRKEIKVDKKTSEPIITDCSEVLPIFISQSFHFNYNFTLVH